MNGRAKNVWYALGLLPAVWLGLLVAPAASGGLFEIIRQFPAAMQHPLHIIWCEDSGKAVLFFAAAYGLLVGVVLSTRRNYRRGVEHGSAKWGSPERLNRKYCAKPPEPNKVFTQHIRMGLDGRKHRRNLNTVVVGGSGAGKTRCYAKPCLYEACLSPKGPSFVCLDPKGELLRDSGLFNVDERHGMHDKFWNRVIFPIMDVNNRVIGFGGRVMGDGKPKYLNSPETAIFDKSRNLYGLNVARTTRKNYLILCEGYMDVISMHQAGFTNAVASLGTALTSGHASLLKRYTQEVLLLYDSDDAGVRAALRAIPILREAGVTSRVVNLKPHKDPDEFIKALGAEEFEKRLEQAMDSFLFRVSMAQKEFSMEDPQGQNRFFERCAQMLLELSDELERNLYIEAIVRDYRSYGITAESLKKRVNALALKGTPAEQRVQPKPSGGQPKKKESAAEKAQKLMLTWLVTYPGIFETVEKYIQPSDFVVPLYRQVAEMLYQQHREGDVNPARLMNAFIDSEEQREVSSLFNATIHLETPEEQNRAFSDTVLRIKDESLKERNRTWDPTDMQGLQEIVKAKKELEDLGRKRQQLHISFE